MAYEIVFAHGIWQVLARGKNFIPHNIGVYGATETGKTTLDKQFTTKGEVRELGLLDRTHHDKTHFLSRELKLPNATSNPKDWKEQSFLLISEAMSNIIQCGYEI